MGGLTLGWTRDTSVAGSFLPSFLPSSGGSLQLDGSVIRFPMVQPVLVSVLSTWLSEALCELGREGNLTSMISE